MSSQEQVREKMTSYRGDADILTEAYLNVENFKPWRRLDLKKANDEFEEECWTSLDLLIDVGFDVDTLILDLMGVEWNEEEVEECCKDCGQNIGQKTYVFECQDAHNMYDNISKDNEPTNNEEFIAEYPEG